MKKVLSLIIAVLLAGVMCSSLTLAQSTEAEQPEEPAHHENTLLCIEMLEEYKVEYVLMETDDNGYDRIAVKLTDEESMLPYELRFYIHPSGESISVRVWDVIRYDAAKMVDVLTACNKANKQWKYVTFVAEEDNTVTIEMDLLCGADDVKELCWKAIMHIGNAAAGAYSGELIKLAATPEPTAVPEPTATPEPKPGH